MDTFRVALSGDLMKPDGSPAYPSFDLSPLTQDPRIECAYIPRRSVVPAEDIEGFDALILLSARFAKDSFPAGVRLSVIARFGVGFDKVDVRSCTNHGVALVNTPDAVRRPVAVAILTFLLALAGRLKEKDRLTRRGAEAWQVKSEHMGVGLVGKTLGSIGIGNIGAEMFRLASPFGMRFLASDPYADPAVPRSLGVRMVDLQELFRESDFLAVNCPLNEDTRRLVSAELLELMKPTAFLINTARGGIIDQDALTRVLLERRIAGAGLDVFEQEPVSDQEPLLELDNVLLAPHALSWTDQCFGAIGAADVKAVLDVMHGRVPENVVNQDILEHKGWLERLRDYRRKFGER